MVCWAREYVSIVISTRLLSLLLVKKLMKRPSISLLTRLSFLGRLLASEIQAVDTKLGRLRSYGHGDPVPKVDPLTCCVCLCFSDESPKLLAISS